MKTIRTWLNELPTNEREKAFRYEKPEWDNWKVNAMNVAIGLAFLWPDNEFEYWAEIANRYK